MINAKEARYESKYRAEIIKIEKEIEQAILKATKKGKMYCDISIDKRTAEEVFGGIIKDLTNLGYKTNLTNFRITEQGFPCDQMNYYECLTVNWEE